MDRATNLVRRNVVFAGVAAAALAVLLLRPAPSAAVPTTFPKAFRDFDSAKVRAIEVSRVAKRDGKDVPESIRLVQRGADDWVVESAGGYPARLASVKRFLDSLSSIEVRNEPTSNPEKFAQYAGSDGFTEVRIEEDGGRVRLSFAVGAGNAEGSWQDRYLRIDDLALGAPPAAVAPGAPVPPAKGRIVVAHGGELSDVRPDLTSWVETRLWPSLSEGDVLTLAVEQRSKDRTMAFARGTKGEKDTEDPWTMTKPEEGKTHADRVKNLLRAFTNLSLSKVVGRHGGAAEDATYGFDKPELVLTAEGRPPPAPRSGEKPPPPTWSVTIGKKSDAKDVDGWFARRSTNGKPDDFVVLVPDYALGEMRAEPSSFLDKPEPPAPPKDGDKKDGDKPKEGDAAKPGGASPPPATPPVPPEKPTDKPAEPAPAPRPPEPPAMGETPPTPPAPAGMDGDKPK
jgi:hypothetical protein